ncbi:MAG TPA: amidase [Bacteroidales bacterium]|jgi:amidase|nr:amidase [Bacteroidales bacterium]
MKIQHTGILHYTIILTILIMLPGCDQGKKPPTVNIDPEGRWLEEMTIIMLQQGYKEGRYTVRDVVSAYLGRIDEIDRKGPGLNSVIAINPDAIQIAGELDAEMKQGKIRGPMHGVPVLLKDNIDTHDKMPTTAGATALAGSIAPADSRVARKLREAGAVIIGKANLSEWANFRASPSSSGWSGVGGQTKNPYVLDRNPCGSSSGSGAAVSANLCMVSIGTETNGSIVCPSNNNGIVGIKPTVGLISRTGIIPISFTQDTPGPMARTVEDAAICLGILTGTDPSDSKTLLSEGHAHTDYRQFLSEEGLQGKRLGIIKWGSGFHEKVDTLMKRAIAFMKTRGAEIIEVELPDGAGYEDASFQVLLYEFKDGLNKYLSGLGEGSRVKSLRELIEFNKKDPVELRFFNQKILEMADKKGDLSSAEYRESLRKMLRAARDEGIDRVMNSAGLDALVAPTGSPAWKTDLILGDHSGGGSSSPAAISGYPAITVPMGFIDELPVGITFFGRAWSEPVLLEIAYSYEQGTKHRSAPRFLATD